MKMKIKKETESVKIGSGFSHDSKKTIFDEISVVEQLAPDGINPNPNSYMVINDMGRDIYIRTFYIEKLPKRTEFAITFAPLLNFPGASAAVFINPMLDGRAVKLLDKRVRGIETEVIGAQKSGDRNRIRKMANKLVQAEAWAAEVESGNNKLFEVAFVFTIYAESLDSLAMKSSDLIMKARERGIELCACFGVQPEAYISNGPFNQIYKAQLNQFIKCLPVRKHCLDKFGLADIFNHTNACFSHPNGIPAGRNMYTGEPILWDNYAASHNGFSVIICGKTGVGKSATVKMFCARMKHLKYRFACIDSERVGGKGEYSILCERLGGVNFQLKLNSKNIINIFELDIQYEFDNVTKTEYKTLRVLDKVADVKNIIMTMVIGDKEKPDFDTVTYMERIVSDAVSGMYNEKGIIDGDADSLFEEGQVLNADGRIGTGIHKKALPTLGEAYLKIYRMSLTDRVKFHKEAYILLLDSLADFVKELHYRTEDGELVSGETYESDMVKHKKVVGAMSYFDGQSTIAFDETTSFINIDISDLPGGAKHIAQEIALNFLSENFIKKNSENASKAGKLIVIVDEAHRMFKYETARKFLNDQFRTARKRNAAIWICTQNLADFSVSKDTEDLIKSATSIFLFKQDPQDKKYLLENTVMTASQVDAVIALGGDPNDTEDKSHKGEVCLIDTDKVVFLKVDYLRKTEAYIVESDISEIKKLIEGGRDEN